MELPSATPHRGIKPGQHAAELFNTSFFLGKEEQTCCRGNLQPFPG